MIKKMISSRKQERRCMVGILMMKAKTVLCVVVVGVDKPVGL
jgi:hypothetical protein